VRIEIATLLSSDCTHVQNDTPGWSTRQMSQMRAEEVMVSSGNIRSRSPRYSQRSVASAGGACPAGSCANSHQKTPPVSPRNPSAPTRSLPRGKRGLAVSIRVSSITAIAVPCIGRPPEDALTASLADQVGQPECHE
jgi:hypothetical protein